MELPVPLDLPEAGLPVQAQALHLAYSDLHHHPASLGLVLVSVQVLARYLASVQVLHLVLASAAVLLHPLVDPYYLRPAYPFPVSGLV